MRSLKPSQKADSGACSPEHAIEQLARLLLTYLASWERNIKTRKNSIVRIAKKPSEKKRNSKENRERALLKAQETSPAPVPII